MAVIADSLVSEIINKDSLTKRLSSGRKLVIKFGVDPTSPDLHLGHAIALYKLRQFQQLGHQTVLLIGDFTTKIGDPSGRNSTRPLLTDEEIAANLKTYIEQARLIIDPRKTKIEYNSRWLSKQSYADFIKMAMRVSLQTLLEREDFSSRLKNKQPIALHELFYPVTQGFDSVEMKADVEIGGWDQRLNLLMGRELQKKFGQPAQDIVVTRALVGTDGQKKMSKSYGNYIGLTESADSMFGKVMSIPDSLVVEYGELAALMGDEVQVKAKLKGLGPRDQKALVAKTIVALYHGDNGAQAAERAFNQTFRDKKVADHLAADLVFNQDTVSLLHAVSEAAESSHSQALRLIAQGAVKIDGQKMADPNFEVKVGSGTLLQVGKHTWRNLRRRA